MLILIYRYKEVDNNIDVIQQVNQDWQRFLELSVDLHSKHFNQVLGVLAEKSKSVNNMFCVTCKISNMVLQR